MANTYTQLHIHLVCAVKNRRAFIAKEWKDELEKYITTIIQNQDHKLLAISAMPDHLHVFFGYNPNQLIPELVNSVKACSSGWINKRRFIPHKFNWQIGYGAFSKSHSHIDRVVKYINNQEEHHRKKAFREEYEKMLKDFEVIYNPQYLFEFFD